MATKSSSTGAPPAKKSVPQKPAAIPTAQNQKKVGDEKKTAKKSKKPQQEQKGGSFMPSASNLTTKSSPPSSSSTPPKSNNKHHSATSSSSSPTTNSSTSELDDCNVFVKHLPSTLTDEGLRNLFTKWGEIVSCRVMIDPRTKTSYGYGFVRFSDPKEAQEAIKHMNGFGIENKSLLCKLSNRSAQTERSGGAAGESEGSPIKRNRASSTAEPNKQVQYSTTTLYIRHLPAHIYTPEQLKSLFSRFGTVTEARVLTDPYTRLSRQVAFVRFAEEAEAKQALDEMHGKKLDFPNAKPNAAPLVVQYAQEQKTEASSESQPPFKSPSKRKSKQANPVPGLSPTPRYYKPQAGLPVQQEQGDYQYIDDSPTVEGEEKEVSAATTISSEAAYPNPYGNMGYYSSYPINFYPYTPQYNPYYPYYYPYSAVPQQVPAEGIYEGTPDNVGSDVPDQGQETVVIDEGVAIEGELQENVHSDVSPAIAAEEEEGEEVQQSVPPTKHFRKASGSGSQIPAHQDANLFIFHLPSDVDDSGLYSLFSRFGSIESVKVITDRNTGESRGYGFVKYYNLEDAITAIGAMNGFRVGKKQLTVSFKTQGTKNPSPLMTSTSSSAPSSSVAPPKDSIGKMLLWPQANTTFTPQILTKKNEEAIKASTTSTTPSDNQKDEQTSPRLQQN